MSLTQHAPRMAPTPGCVLVARHEFTYGTRTFAAGERFDWREMGLVEEQAFMLWRSTHLEIADEAPVAPVAATSPQPQRPAQQPQHKRR